MSSKRAVYVLYAFGVLCASSGLALAGTRGMETTRAEQVENGFNQTDIQLARMETRAETAKYKAVKRFINRYR